MLKIIAAALGVFILASLLLTAPIAMIYVLAHGNLLAILGVETIWIAFALHLFCHSTAWRPAALKVLVASATCCSVIVLLIMGYLTLAGYHSAEYGEITLGGRLILIVVIGIVCAGFAWSIMRILRGKTEAGATFLPKTKKAGADPG